MPNWPKLVGHDLWSATPLAFKSPRINSSSFSGIPLMVVVILYQSTKWNLSQFAPRVSSGNSFLSKLADIFDMLFAVFRMLISFNFLSVTTRSGRLPSLSGDFQFLSNNPTLYLHPYCRRKCEALIYPEIRKYTWSQDRCRYAIFSQWHRWFESKIRVLLTEVEPMTFSLLVQMLYH